MAEITEVLNKVDKALAEGRITVGQVIDAAPQSVKRELFKVPVLNSDDMPKYDGKFDNG